MINLDDTQSIINSQGGEAVITSTRAFPKQIVTSYKDAGKMDFGNGYENIKNIVICGMGGSRFPGLIAFHFFKDTLSVPLLVCDDYVLPEFVNTDSLVVLSSYSGTTEEVVHLGELAKAKGAKIAGFCVGGALGQFLASNNYPRYIFEPVLNPSKQPRIGFGYAIGAIFAILAKLNILRGVSYDSMNKIIEKECGELEEFCKKFDFSEPEKSNPAKQMAKKLYDTYPYIVVAEHLIGLGNAIQNQINETSKNISSYRVIPELNHHLMESLKHPEIHRKIARFLMIESAQYSGRVQKRYVVTKDVVEQNEIKVLSYKTRGLSKMGDVFEMAAFGSYMSMYMAALYGVDPAKIPYVDYFKEQLKS